MTEKEWFSPQELADWLDIPRRTIYQWNADGTAPKYVKIGTHLRYRKCDVEAWLAARQAPVASAKF